MSMMRYFLLGWLFLGLVATPIKAAELSTRDLDAFFDGFVPMQLKEHDIAGALVVVTYQGQVLCSKSYGVKDIATQEPMEATTPMRIGSLSKVATFTAIMKLVEEGKLELQRDINDYLDFKIHRTYPEPVTLKHLMTHTAGFEQVWRNSVVSSADKLTSLRDYLIENQPERIFPPGEVIADSDYGTCLAAYLIERVTHESFENYIQANLFAPLDMHGSHFDQDKTSFSNGSKNGKTNGSYLVQTFPAEGMTSSAYDLTQLMKAHLGYAGGDFLRKKTLKLMHGQAFSVDPHIMGMALGFFETTRNGHYILTHLGDAPGFQGQFSLIPDSKVGFLFLMNCQGSLKGISKKCLRSMLWKQFLNRYFPDPSVPSLANNYKKGSAVSGFYMNVKRSESSFLRTLDILLRTHRVQVNNDGTLTFTAICDYNGEPKVWHPLSKDLYSDANNRGHLLFHQNDHGNWMLFSDIGTFQACAWYETKTLSLALLIFSSLTFFLTLAGWGFGKLLRYHYNRPLQLSLEAIHWRYLARLACLYNAALISSWFLMFYWMRTHPSCLSSSFDSCFYLLEFLSILSLVSMLVMLVNVYKSWMSRRSLMVKLHDMLMFLASVALIWLVFIFNMMHVNVQY